MARTAALRAADYKPLYMLLGECRHAGAFPHVWPNLMHGRLEEWLGISLTLFHEGDAAMARGLPSRPPRVHACGEPVDRIKALMPQYWESGAHRSDPLLKAWSQLEGPMRVCTRQELASDGNWYASDAYREFFSKAGVDQLVMARFRIASGRHMLVNFWRPTGADPFHPREARLLALLVQELAALMAAGDISTLFDAGRLGLSGRLLEVLELLLSGSSEKEIAIALRLSLHTVHGYVKTIYERLEVHGRASLAALAGNGWPAGSNGNHHSRLNLRTMLPPH